MSILNKILINRDKLSASGKKIADWVLTAPDHAIKLNSQALAKEVNVSQSSIVKFAQKLGFSGFSQFKQGLIQEVSRKSAVHGSPLHTNIVPNDSYATIALKLAKAKSDAIFQTSNALMTENFEKVVKLVNQANRVQIVGMGGSALSGKDLAYKLLKLGVAAVTELDSHVQIGIARTLTSEDVQIVVSFLGETKEINIAAETAKERGATIVAFTSPAVSELRNIAHICLDTIADESQNRASSMVARTAQNVVTDALFISLVKMQGDSGQEMIQDISSQIQMLT
ncbi:MurR/RpiR family transcriptional regulator [Vibrio sp. ER1A]|uniref:MurR/RpiR family transcriptional regulator n=1 Tax=Vibrio sp. ER1A TaxID=1517681 RepID=UPI0004DCB0A0|nr:MurR/RpiR family transcriptional regulator [Vibrio sp. ER1A]KFA99391.1 XRE family transcriptional regulator [Vibrio sp. ER1A]